MLQAEHITKHYGGVAALRDARIEVRAGEVHALIGGNGAGKSTLAKILAGSVQPDRAAVRIAGRPVEITNPLDAQRHGIGIIYQELDLFPNLSAGENIVIGNLRFSERGLVSRRRIEAFCRPFMDQVGLDCGVWDAVSALPIGKRQLLAIARALSMEARVIFMDEPTSSLVDDAVERLFGLIRDLKARGVSVVYVSHKMDEIFRIADRITVLRDGETIDTLDTAAATPEEVVRLMVGREFQMAARSARSPGEVVLKVDRLTTDRLTEVSFDLRRGEVLGIAGLVGSGRSELGAALFGLERARGGTVHYRGSRLKPRSAREAIRHGIGLVPEDRRLEGLMMDMSVVENGTIAALPGIARFGFTRPAPERAALMPVAGQLALNCPSLDAPVDTLSGGNQQKVLLARWLLLQPGVLFLDDPTRGIDIAAKQDIYRMIDSLADAGKSVILVSSELPELLRCADRILVLSNGRAAALYDAKEATQEKIMASATNIAWKAERA